MRTFVICALLLLVAFYGYAWNQNPKQCKKIGQDLNDLVISLVRKEPAPVAATAPTPPGPNLIEKTAAPATAAITKRVDEVASVEAPPVAAPAPAPTPVAAPVPFPPPVKRWVRPDPLPARPSWLWTTISGKSYMDVVITDLKPDTVSFTHSMGSATVPINLLTTDLQEKLNYDPEAAAAAKAEDEREKDHPYYRIASLAEAQAVARQLRWPLAWLEAPLDLMNQTNPAANSDAELCQMSLDYLKSRAVVVLLDGNNDLAALSPIIRDGQLFQLDDGPLPGGHHFYAPKIVFSDAAVTKALGRVANTQMKPAREAAIEAALTAIAKDPATQALLNGPPSPAVK